MWDPARTARSIGPQSKLVIKTNHSRELCVQRCVPAHTHVHPLTCISTYMHAHTHTEGKKTEIKRVTSRV